MDNLSIAGTDVSSLIGALELGDQLESHDDGVLETAGAAAHELAGPVTAQPWTGPCCGRVSDDALLRSADVGIAGPPPTAGLVCTPTVLCR